MAAGVKQRAVQLCQFSLCWLTPSGRAHTRTLTHSLHAFSSAQQLRGSHALLQPAVLTQVLSSTHHLLSVALNCADQPRGRDSGRSRSSTSSMKREFDCVCVWMSMQGSRAYIHTDQEAAAAQAVAARSREHVGARTTAACSCECPAFSSAKPSTHTAAGPLLLLTVSTLSCLIAASLSGLKSAPSAPSNEDSRTAASAMFFCVCCLAPCCLCLAARVRQILAKKRKLHRVSEAVHVSISWTSLLQQMLACWARSKGTCA